MKIEKMELSQIGFRKGGAHKYSNIFDKLKSLKVGEAIKVTLDESDLNFYALLYQYFRRTRFPEYRMAVRKLDNTGKLYGIAKVKR